jgi:hypothetical protein
LDAEEEQVALQKAQQLVDGGFISQEEFRPQELDYKIAQLALTDIQHRYIQQIVQILQAYGFGKDVLFPPAPGLRDWSGAGSKE